jgi:uncharacterized YigZ family protein
LAERVGASYLIPVGRHEHELVVRRSRFLAILAPAASPDAARVFVQTCRDEHPKANHHCWAYVCGPPGSPQVGMSDDGEPSGTAGPPMLQVLSHAGVGDIVAVVVRYFGGVKLGTGGLVRAYSGALQDALASLPLGQHTVWAERRLHMSYADEPLVRRLLPTGDAELLDARYTDEVLLHIRVPEPRVGALIDLVVSQTNGRIRLAAQ